MTSRATVPLIAVAFAAGVSVARADGPTERVSVASSGTQADAGSYRPAVSANGRYVAFNSAAGDLVAGDTNGVGCQPDPSCGYDVFVRDRETGATERVSITSSGAQAGFGSVGPSISANGRLVAFQSIAADLVASDANGAATDVFVHDRKTGRTELVSVSTGGVQGDSVSYAPAISADGRFVAFGSFADNLVPDDTNRQADVFVRDRQLGTTERVSVGTHSAQANGSSASNNVAISGHGRFVAFSSNASNLVAGDTNGSYDVFVRDRQLGTTERVSVGTDGRQGDADSGLSFVAISTDGRFVAFGSDATDLVPGDTNGKADVFVRDRKLGTTQRASVGAAGEQANDGSGRLGLDISGNGRYVLFYSTATNLVPGDTNGAGDVFLRDLKAGKTRRVSLASRDAQGNGRSWSPAITKDGGLVAFSSLATNLVPGDTNKASDVFVRAR